MIVTIHQPEYLPYMGFFDRIDKTDVFVILDTVKYQKNGFMNRNRVKSAQGDVWVTIPVKGEDKSKNINEVRISNELAWKTKHWNLIKESYRRAPYFKEYSYLFEEALLKREWEYISDLDCHLIQIVMDILGIRKKVVKSSNLKATGKAAELNINILHELGADTYLSGPGNEDYKPPVEEFKAAGISMMFHRYVHPEYSQLYPEKGFLPYMCILDIIFNHGPKSLEIIRIGRNIS